LKEGTIMDRPVIIYQVWSRTSGMLNDQLVSNFYDRESAEDGCRRFKERCPEYDYFIREYKNPGV
jgi:hypothetical protein